MEADARSADTRTGKRSRKQSSVSADEEREKEKQAAKEKEKGTSREKENNIPIEEPNENKKNKIKNLPRKKNKNIFIAHAPYPSNFGDAHVTDKAPGLAAPPLPGPRSMKASRDPFPGLADRNDPDMWASERVAQLDLFARPVKSNALKEVPINDSGKPAPRDRLAIQRMVPAANMKASLPGIGKELIITISINEDLARMIANAMANIPGCRVSIKEPD